MENQVIGDEIHEHCHIEVDDEAELRFWKKELQVDERTLRTAVGTAGSSVDKVREYLRTSQGVIRRSDLPRNR